MASLRLAPDQKIINTSDSFAIRVILDTEGESVNAYEGAISFPTDLLELTSIETRDSMIPFWVERPHAVNGSINFTGMTPGGYQGDNGLFFTMVFKTKEAGEGNVGFTSATVLKNDGLGTSVATALQNSRITVSDKTTTVPRSVIPPVDREPPEHFIPEIAQSQVMFDGQWFVSFVAQDKGSGINHYEVRELKQTPFDSLIRWQTATSPHLLHDQSRASVIEVKAVDNAGNERIERLQPDEEAVSGSNLLVNTILALLILAAGILVWKLWKRFHKK